MIQILIFDIGGVLVKINIKRFVNAMSQALNVSRLRLYLYHNRGLFQQIMRGEVTIMALREDLMRHFKRDLDKNQFAEIWASMLDAPQPEIIELARQLGSDYQTVILSNIEAAHHQQLQDSMDFLPYFSTHFMSYELNLAKPDPAIYQTVLNQLEVSPAECFFIDDRRENVVAARKLGIKSHQFRNSRKLRRDLTRHGILN